MNKLFRWLRHIWWLTRNIWKINPDYTQDLVLGWDLEFQFLNKDKVTSFTECTKDFYAFFLLMNANVNEDTLGQM